MAGIFEILCGIIMLIIALRYYYTSTYNFWEKRGVPGPKVTLFFGNVKDIFLRKTTMMKYWVEVYNAYKSAPLVGIFVYSTPILIVNDLELIKDVLIRDAMVFPSRGMPYSKGDPITQNIVRLGEEILHLRTKILQIFTSNKMKNMFPLLLQRLEVFNDWLDTLLSQNEQINCTDLAEKLIADLSSTYVFGYDIKSIGDENNEIVHCIKNLNTASWKNITKEFLMETVTQLYNLVGYYLFDNDKSLKIFTHFVNDVTEYRKKHGIVKHDIANIFMKLRQDSEITDEFVVANYYAFFVAALETSTATMVNMLYELALNQIVQDKLREEIHSMYAENDGKITFDNLNAMSYLDAVFKEALRKYPISDALPRLCTKTYTFRNSQVTIPKGQKVIIPVKAIHYDPEIYPKPTVFDPERFLNERAPFKQSMRYIPFGHGLRNCVGERFGILQTKMGVITILRSYKVDICDKTYVPYEYSAELFVQQSKEMHLKMTKIN